MLTLIFTDRQGVTFDEPDYFAYAVEWAKGNPTRQFPIMDSKTPMVGLSLIPAVFKPLLPASLYADNIFFFLLAGRPFMYVYQLLGAFVTCCWMFRLAGPKRWIIPWLFFLFDPLVFSYGMIIGSDIASASLLVTVVYLAWRYTRERFARYWWGLCLATALAVVTKASMLFCYPLLVMLFIVDALQQKKFRWKVAFAGAVQFVLIQLLVINLAYYFSGSFTALGSIDFESNAYRGLQKSLSVLKDVPVPLPLPFIQGIDMLKHHAEIGGCKPESTYYGVHLLGRVVCDRPVWYYYIVAAAIKLPLLNWLIMFLFLGRILLKGRLMEKLRQQVFTWLPFIYFLLILSFANKFQIGIRHALIIAPFLFIGLSSTITWFFDRYRKLFLACTVLHLASIMHYYPNIMAYTNELVWDKKNVYRIMSDSSIDYGQSDPWLKAFVKVHPEYTIPTNVPDTGKFAISVARLFTEHEGEAKNIEWLRNYFKPDDSYRYTVLLFDISAQDLAQKGLTPGRVQ